MKRLFVIVLAAVLSVPGAAAEAPIKIAHVYDQIGALADYGRQLQVGLALGFEYATDGSNRVLGRPLVLIEKDSRLQPELARALLTEAYAEEGAVLAVGPLAPHVALGSLEAAAEQRRILIAQSVADDITGKAWNRYVFRVGRSWSQDAIANAIVAARPGACIATITQDYQFGRDGIAAYRKAANKLGAIVYHEEYVADSSRLDAGIERLVAALADRGACRDRHIFAIWAGDGQFLKRLLSRQIEANGIRLTLGGGLLLQERARQALQSIDGAVDYHYLSPANPVNDWLVVEHLRRFNSPPSAYVAQGMAEALFIVAALEKAGSTDTEALIEAMEGLSFLAPKGRLVMRPEDHQALQPMFHLRIAPEAGRSPLLVREIRAREIELPIRNRP